MPFILTARAMQRCMAKIDDHNFVAFGYKIQNSAYAKERFFKIILP